MMMLVHWLIGIIVTRKKWGEFTIPNISYARKVSFTKCSKSLDILRNVSLAFQMSLNYGI